MTKRVSLVLMCLFLGVMGSSCQASPEETWIANKDAEQLDEAIHQAKETTENILEESTPKSETMPLLVESYQDTYEGAEKSVQITIDAQITWPEGNLPILRVKPRSFVSEDVKLWAEALLEGNTAYSPPIVMSKKEIEQKILEIHRILSDEESIWANAGSQEDFDDLKAFWESELAAYETAPESVGMQESDWRFYPRGYYEGGGDYHGMESCKVISTIDKKPATLIVNNCENQGLQTHNLWYWLDGDIYEKGKLQTTKEEAVEIGRQLLDQVQLSHYQLIDCRVYEDEYKSYYDLKYTPVYEGQGMLDMPQLQSWMMERASQHYVIMKCCL